MTRAPPIRPFQKQTSGPALPANSGPALPGPATSSQEGSGSHLRPNEPSTTSGDTENISSPRRPAELADHDYSSRIPTPLTDHNYFMSVPLPVPGTRPPPGFEHYQPEGRPKRKIKFPSKYDDYET